MISRDIKALTGVRFFAALWVVLFHFKDELEPISFIKPLKWVIDLGHFAVPMFFILSGFILSHTYFARYSLSNHADFIYRRFARMWPVHLVSVLSLFVYIGIIVAHSGHIESDNYSIQNLPLELTLVRCWLSKDLVWNYPAWSIHAEWFAYVFLFPIAFLLFRQISSRLLLIFTIGTLLGAHTFLPISQFPGMCAEIIFLFLAGSAIYRLRVLIQDLPGTWFATAGLLLFVISISGLFNHSISLIYLAFALLVLGLSYDGGWIAQLLSQRTIVYGGTISYSIYMTHAVVLKFYSAVGHKLGWQTQESLIAGALVFIGAVLVTGSAFYHVIEAPCNKTLRKHSPFEFDLMERERIK
ncbi:MAG: acyltransferase [Nitrospira sp.]|nr:acyltransferase [Nitrospira sp.]